MPFHVDRFLISFEEVVGKAPSSLLDVELSDYKSVKTPVQKAAFIKKLMEELLTKTSKHAAEKVMLECGYMMRDGVSRCINEHKIKRTKVLFAEARNLEDFFEKYNKHSGGSLKLKGNLAKATYDRCYCGSVSQAKEKIPLTYCYCGAGWYKRLFEEVLGRPVRVEAVQSIASGADKCLFKIVLQDG